MKRFFNHINSFSLRIIAVMILICFISITGVSIFSFYYIDKEINDEIINYNNTQLYHIKDKIDVNLIQSSFAILSNILVENENNSVLHDFYKFGYSEKMSTIPEIRDTLKEYTYPSNPNISSAIIYYVDEKIAISSDSGVKFVEEEAQILPFDYLWIDEFIGSEDFKNVQWLRLREKPVFQAKEIKTNLITLAATLPFGTNQENYKGIIALNIDQATIETMLREIIGDSSKYVSIIDKTGNYILKSNEFDENLYNINNILDFELEETGKVISYEGEDIVFIYLKSDYNDWYYLYSIPISVYYEKKELSRRILLSTFTIIFSVLMIVTIIISKRITKPFKKLSAKVRTLTGAQYENEKIYDIALVNNTLDLLSEKTKTLEERIVGNKSIVKNSFTINLLNGYFIDPNEIDKRMKYLDIKLDKKVFFVCLVSINMIMANKKRLIYQINISKHDDFTILATDFSEQYISIIVNTESGGINNLKEIVGKIIDIITLYGGGDFQLAVGMTKDNIYEIKESFDSAINCARYFTYSKSMKVFEHTIVSAWDNNTYDFTKDINRMFISLTDLDKEDFKNYLYKINKIITSTPVSFLSYKKCAEEIILSMNKFIRCNNIEENIQLIDTNEFIDLNKNIDEIFSDIIKIGEMLIDEATAIRRNDINSEYVKRTKKFIEENFYKDISLQDIADSMHVTKNHICRVFKQSTTNTILNYLMDFRMEKARELIINTQESIVHISKQVGYSNASYFSKKFKEKYGVVPHKYREYYLNSDI